MNFDSFLDGRERLLTAAVIVLGAMLVVSLICRFAPRSWFGDPNNKDNIPRFLRSVYPHIAGTLAFIWLVLFTNDVGSTRYALGVVFLGAGMLDYMLSMSWKPGQPVQPSPARRLAILAVGPIIMIGVFLIVPIFTQHG